MAIPKLTLKNIGFCSKLCMVFNAVHATGMAKSMPFLFPLASLRPFKILAFTRILSGIPRTYCCHIQPPSLSRPLRGRFCLHLQRSSVRSFILSSPCPLQGRFHGHHQMVPQHSLFLAGHPLFCHRPSQPIRFCFQSRQKFLPQLTRSDSNGYTILLRRSYQLDRTF